MNRLRNIIQTFVIFTNNWPVLKLFYRIFYKVSVRIVARCLSGFREIKSIYLRGSMVTGFTPGVSDIDLLIVTVNLSEDKNVLFLDNFWKRYFLLKKIFPQLGHTEIFCEDEIDEYLLFQIFVNFSKSYNKSLPVKNIYGPYTLNTDMLNTLLKEIPRDLLKYILLYDDYLKLMLGFYYLDASVNPKIYTRPLSRILNDRTGDKFILTKQLDEDYILDSSLAAINIVTARCKCQLKNPIDYKTIQLHDSKYNFKPQTYDYVAKSIKPIAGALFQTTKDCVESIILSSDIGANYSYHFVAVLKDNLNISQYKKAVYSMKEFYKHLNNPVKEYFIAETDWPVILNRDMLICFGNTIPRTGYFYLLKHGLVLCGKNIIPSLPSLAQTSRLDINLLISETKCLFNSPGNNLNNLSDLAYGGLPAARLMLDKKVIATTPREVFEEYCQNFSHEKETNIFKIYHENQMQSKSRLLSANKEDFRQAYAFGKYCLKAIRDNN